MNLNVYNFKDKTAFVTGGASGIGAATVEAFANCGAKVAIVDTNEELGIALAKRLTAQDKKVLFIKCDTSKNEQVKFAIDETIKKYGSLDFAFNNAGIEGVPAPTAECTEENFDRLLAVNLKGVWLCMKHQIPQMLKQGQGSIVNCSSIAGIVGFQGSPGYVASKHGVNGLTKTAALDYAKNKIRVNSVCPGVIQTPMIDRFTKGDEKVLNYFASSEPIGRVGQPNEIASAVLWLCSDQSTFVTGHTLTIDGGWVAQ